jgi:hypothetical protein
MKVGNLVARFVTVSFFRKKNIEFVIVRVDKIILKRIFGK